MHVFVISGFLLQMIFIVHPFTMTWQHRNELQIPSPTAPIGIGEQHSKRWWELPILSRAAHIGMEQQHQQVTYSTISDKKINYNPYFVFSVINVLKKFFSSCCCCRYRRRCKYFWSGSSSSASKSPAGLLLLDWGSATAKRPSSSSTAYRRHIIRKQWHQ